jgi:sugar phosphate isomerase/epimerase
MATSRRQFLTTLSSAAAACVATENIFAAPVKQTPIALGIDNFAVRAMGWKASELIQYAAKLNLDTLFLSDLDCLPSLEDAPLSEVKAQADAAGLKLYVGSWSICPTSVRFKPKWGKAEEHLRTGIRVAKALGSPVFRVILGAADDRKTPGGIQARINDCVQVLKACRSAALESSIKIAVENHAGDLHSWELLELVEKAGPEFVGVNIDSGNAAWTLEDPLDLLERLGPHTVCSSLRDDMIWETPEGASVQWTAMGEGLVDWARYVERWRALCPGVPFQIETISGFSRAFPYKTEDFWNTYSRRPEALAKFEALAKKGRPLPSFQAPSGVDKKVAEQEYQRGELERSVKYCKEVLGLGLRRA